MTKAGRNLRLTLITALLIIGAGFFVAHGAYAQTISANDLGISYGAATGLGATDIRLTIARIIRAVLGFLGVIAVLVILYGGFQFMTAGGNEEKVAEAKKILFNGVLGLIIILSAFAIASFVVSKLIGATTGAGGGAGGGDGGGGAGGGGFVSNVFYVNSLPQAGSICIRNISLLVVFNKEVDLATLGGNVVVTDSSAADAEVPGNWKYGKTKNMVIFIPDGSCAPSAGNDCYKPETTYKLVFKNAANVKTLDKNPELALNCRYKAGCGPVSFKSGLGVDRLPPTVTITYPMSDSLLQPGATVPVKMHYSDDNGVQNLSLSFAKGASSSTLIDSVSFSGCKQSDDVTIQWPTGGVQPGVYTLSAVATDWAGLNGSDTAVATLRPGQCFNGLQDPNEAGVDCGGTSGCGCCAGAACSASQCASGTSINGICRDVMRIDSFSPASGAPGTFVTVSGRWFGETPGKVYFATTNNPVVGNPGDWKEAKVVNCGNVIDNWSDRQILVEVPVATAVSSPIKVEAAPVIQNGVTTTPIDVTSNHNLANFEVTTLVRPGICVLNPNHGQAGDLVAINGKNFGTLKSASDDVVFGSLKAVVAQNQNGTPAWAPEHIVVATPQLAAGLVGVTVTKDGVPSNSVRFLVAGGATANQPFISSIMPNHGAAGDYITITGGNFGDTIGSVWFKATPTSQAIIGNFSFPAACQKNVWTDKKIIVKFPSGGGSVNTNYLVQINTSDNRASAIDSNQTFKLEAGEPAPGICSITPLSGPIPFPAGQAVRLAGEYFLVSPPGGTTGPLPTDVYFWSGAGNPGAITGRPIADRSNILFSITTTTITVRPPDTVVTGPVSVYRGLDQKISNPINFSVGDCRTNASLCAAGTHCCISGDQAGVCKASSELCLGETRSTGYIWRFSTKDLPPVPHVVERCDAATESGSALPTPTPNIQWDANNQGDHHAVCASALVVVEFTTPIDQATVSAQNVLVNRCTSVDNKNNCVNPVMQALTPDSYRLFTAQGTRQGSHSYIELQNTAAWQKGIWYQVVLNNKIKSAVGAGTVSLPLSQDKPCGGTSAYCFVFQGGGQPCVLNRVVVTPYNYLTEMLEAPMRRRTAQGAGAPVDYVGSGLSNQRCILMDVSGYDWRWTSGNTTYAGIYNTSTGRIVNVSADANTVGVGLVNDSVAIQAAATTNTPGGPLTKQGQSPLTIDLTNPTVVDYWPKCLEACTNADVAVQFNVSLSMRNIDRDAIERGVVKLNKCNDENCLNVTQVGVSSDVVLDPQAPFAILHIANSTNGSVELEPNQLYQVVVSAVNSDPAATNQVWSRARSSNSASFSKPFNQEFTWRFRTKKDKCIASRVAVTPAEFTAQFITDRQVYTAQPFSSPDACSSVGQRLNPWKMNWTWTSTNPMVASVTSFSTKGQNNFCTAACVKKGSSIPSSAGTLWPLCGNGKVEAGEDCDPPGKASGCALDCRFLGNNATSTIRSTDSGLCGDGFVTPSKGEACDPNDPQTKIGCSANCLRLGSLPASGAAGGTASGSICGNGSVGSGEDCDTGISANISSPTSALGCSAKCLHLGTHLTSKWCADNRETLGGFGSVASTTCLSAYSQCGDKVENPEEDPGCDLGGGAHATWCNDLCLANDKSHSKPGCAVGAQGCDENAQYRGSSLAYTFPSVCGDGLVGVGEDPICETNLTLTHEGLVNPWALAIGVGRGAANGTPPAQRTSMTAATIPAAGKTIQGSGTFVIACGYKTDDDCEAALGAGYGVAADSCCYARPRLVLPTVPVDKVTDPVNGAAVCINTAIRAQFDQIIDPATVQGNVLVARGIGAGESCSSSTQDITTLIASATHAGSARPWWKVFFDWVFSMARGILGNQAFAKIFNPPAKWCIGDDPISVTVTPGPSASSYITVTLVRPLAPLTNYAVILKPGIKSTQGVSIGQTAAKKNISWMFDTRSTICSVDSVTVDPSAWYFAKANATTTLTAAAYSNTGGSVLIQSLPGFYSWDYIWAPPNNDSVAVPTTHDDHVIISSKNTNGEATVRASARLIDNVFTAATGTVGSGTSHVVVFLCENPWPPKDIFVEKSVAAAVSTVGGYTPTGYIQDIDFSGNFAFVLSNSYSAATNPGILEILNFTDPAHPVPVSSVAISGWVNGVTVAGNYAYVTYSDSSGVATGSILKIINVSNPSRPVEIANFTLAGWAVWPGKVSIVGGSLYVLISNWSVNSFGSILQVLNITDPAQPTNTVTYPLTVWANAAGVVSGGYYYMTANPSTVGQLTVIDVRDPAHPAVATSYQFANWVQGVPVVAGRSIYIGEYSSDATKFDFITVDISDPLHPTPSGTALLSGWIQGLSVSGNLAYVIDSNPAAGYQYVLRVFDVRDPVHPTLVNTRVLTGWTSGRGIYVSGSYGFLATNSAGSTGSSLEVVTQQAAGTTKVGPFTVFPYEDASGNNDAFDFITNAFANGSIPPSTVNAPGVGDGYFNFSTYYCADNGGAGTFDDLPYLRPAVQTGTADLQGQQGSCEYTGAQCQANSDCGVNYLAAASFVAPASATNVCGGTTSTSAVAKYYLDESGAPLVCSSDTDCSANQSFVSWKQRAGITAGSACLPLSAVPSRALSCYRYPPLKRFFFTNNSNNDAVGIQVFSNPRHLTPEEWYAQDKRRGGQGFQGAFQSTTVDGNRAVSDGNNIYIGGLNYVTSTANLYDLIYVLSINSGAKPETRQVFNAFVKNFKLNTNLVANDGYCGASIATPEYKVSCHSDLDCPGGQVCASQVEKMRRDFQRLRDLRSIETALEAYRGALSSPTAPKYPSLKEGTFLTGQTFSVWSSWSVLGQAVGQTLPVDPVNQLGRAGTCTPIATPPDTAEAHCSRGECRKFCTTDAQCGAGSICTLHDAVTGWSTADRRFNFACATSSYAYRYTYSTTTGFTFRSNIEDIGVPVNNVAGFLSGFGFSNQNRFSGLGFNATGGSGICNRDQEVLTISKGSCGDGQVNVANDEQCDPPGSQRFGSCTGGIVSVEACSQNCQWVASSTPAVSCSYLSRCGNGRVEAGETCDDGNLNGKYNHCNSACSGKVAVYNPSNPTASPGFCGDGQLNPTYELCDNATGQPLYATTPTDKTTSCSADCQSYGTFCGDSVIQSANGEECDPAADASTLACTDPQGNAGSYTCLANCKKKTTPMVLGDRATHWWSFDTLASATTIPDLVGQFDGLCSVVGAPRACTTVVSGGKFGKAWQYDSGTTTIFKASGLNTPAFSIEFWFKPSTYYSDTNSPAILAEGGTNCNSTRATSGYSLEWNFNALKRVVFFVCSNGTRNSLTTLDSTTHFASNQWSHVVATYDGSTMNLYVNGTLIGTAAGVLYTPDSGSFFAVMASPAGAINPSVGLIDELAYYDRALPADVIIRHAQGIREGAYCAVTKVAAATAAPGTCGDGVVDTGEACDTGLAANGVACTPSYGKSCSYCSADCKNRVTVQPTEFCGDGIINGSEACDTNASGVVYAKTTTNPATTSNTLSVANKGYPVLACANEPPEINVFKKGTKICANNCTAILVKETNQATCVRCGIDRDKGVTVRGNMLNVLEAAGSDVNVANDPLYVRPDPLHVGYIKLSDLPGMQTLAFVQQGTTTPSFSGLASDTSLPSSVYTLQYRPTGVNGPAVEAPLATDALCYAGDSGKNYKLTVNYNSDPFLFPIKSVPDPWQYDFTLSPIISAIGLKDQPAISRRANDIRIVTTWVGENNFYSGFVKPIVDNPTAESLSFKQPPTSGFDYYSKGYNDPATGVWGIWYHGSGQTPGLLSEESFTINTGVMQGDTYVFYVRTQDGSAIKNIGRTAKLRVDIYLPRTPATAPDYATFTQPDRSFQFALAAPSDNPGASYWEVLKIQRTPAAVSDRIQDVTVSLEHGRIVTGAAQF